MSKFNPEELSRLQQTQNKIAIADFVNRNLYNHPKYQNPKNLTRYDFQSYSQNGEDGIIEEIFNRIGETNRFFIEFGASKNALENNSIYLLLKGWSGAWIDGNRHFEKRVAEKYETFLKESRLKAKQAFITAENIESLFSELDVPEEFDLLSIDIDGNDYWVWKALEKYRPRTVVVEYNASMGPLISWVMKYNPKHTWDGSNYFGASLKSYERLAESKGYRLVGCNFTWTNAFFVREDVLGDHFEEPFSSENHFQPPRYYLHTKEGHPRNFGEFESL